MASSVPLLSEDQLLCPICLGVFVKPVSTPCGHNFCMTCLSSYWDSSPECLCPVCKESFSHRPQLRVNTFISGLSQSFSSLQLRQEPHTSVLCDVCTSPQRDALMSCVECLSSFCSQHLEPHHRVPGLRRHTLVSPELSLQDRVCPQHQQLLHSYCTKEGALLCAGCEGAHIKHRVLPLEQAQKELSSQLQFTQDKVSTLIQKRVERVCSIRDTKAQRHEETRRVITQSEEVLQDILRKVQMSHKGLVQKMEEKQQQADSEAEDLVVQIEQEMADLIENQTKLQELKQIEEPFLFLKKYSNISQVQLSRQSTPKRKVGLEEMREALECFTSRIQEALKKLNEEISLFSAIEMSTLRRVQRYANNLRFDPDTAHPLLHVSQDFKQVRYKKDLTLKNKITDPKRCWSELAVLADRGFSSGKFYFEVLVGKKQEWSLALVAESAPRDAEIPKLWGLYFRNHTFYDKCSHAVVYKGIVERVGVFVDYDTGLVSSYDVMTATCIHSVFGCVFTGKIYPYFNPCDDEFPSNLEPLILVPVERE